MQIAYVVIKELDTGIALYEDTIAVSLDSKDANDFCDEMNRQNTSYDISFTVREFRMIGSL